MTVPACARRLLGICLSGGVGCLAVLACLSVPRRQEHGAGGREQSQERGLWGRGSLLALSLALNPVESRDSLGCLAKEERKRAGLWEGGWNPLSFSMASSFLVTHSCLTLVQGPEAERQVGDIAGLTLQPTASG